MNPTFDKVTDLALIVIERMRTDMYGIIIKFFKNNIILSSYYQRQQTGIAFNFSSETEHLSVLLPGYEATVRMYIIGAVASKEENYEFISLLAGENIIWLDDSYGEKIYRSIMFHPWFENDYGAGNLTTYFEDAKKRLSEDKYILERYFSLIDDQYVDYLCQFDFLSCLKIVLMGQIEKSYFPYYPNFARYYFKRTSDIIQKFIHQNEELIKNYKIDKLAFKDYLKKLIIYLQQNNRGWQYSWLDTLPHWFGEFLKENST